MMARILTIFGPNESSRRDLFFENFSKGQNEQKYFKKFSEKFSKNFEKIFNYQFNKEVRVRRFGRAPRREPFPGMAWPGLALAGVGLSRIGLARLGRPWLGHCPAWPRLARPGLAWL